MKESGESFRGESATRGLYSNKPAFVELSLPRSRSHPPTTPGMLMAYLSLAHSTICWGDKLDATKSDRHAVLVRMPSSRAPPSSVTHSLPQAGHEPTNVPFAKA